VVTDNDSSGKPRKRKASRTRGVGRTGSRFPPTADLADLAALLDERT
jgi:hypothetical protein